MIQHFFLILYSNPVYEILRIDCSGVARQGTCRIFVVPKYDERGQLLPFRDQRAMAIEMDKFMVNCKCNENFICGKQMGIIFICQFKSGSGLK